MSATFEYMKHRELFTSAVNYSYLTFPSDKIWAKHVNEAGWDYTLSTYTSHQT